MHGKRVENEQKERSVSSGQRLIQNRKILVGIVAFCAYEIVASWRGMDRPAPATYDVATIIVGTFVTTICALVVVRTSFVGDRLVIGPVMIASLMWVLIRIVLPDQPAVYIMRLVVWLMWVLAFLTGIMLLVRHRAEWPGSR
jgi:hypothetical protein